ncbi:MAG: ComEC family competence protein [Rickettsiales bacterium]|nr:ComEC family competence protein [Rickettsiales bacterium]
MKESFAEEFESFPLFAPAFMGAGIALYFGLAAEPNFAHAAAALAFAAVALLASTRRSSPASLYMASFATFFLTLGFFAAMARTEFLDTKLLPAKVKDASVRARVIGVERLENSARITLDNATANDAKAGNIRLKIPGKIDPPAIGKTIEFTSSLTPPFAPLAVGSFDFARYSYYKNISSTSTLYTPYKYSDNQIDNSYLDKLYFNFMNLRESINAKILSSTPPDAAGVLISMTTGDIYAISKRVSEDYRRAGISHMVSISGFHMSLLVAIVFCIVRFAIVLCPPLALRVDGKKFASVIAIFAALFYLMISGARVASTRSFIMAALGLAAILFDKSVLSMRFVAASAVAILALSPESLLNPGFQMSFLAVAILIRIYDARKLWLTRAEAPFAGMLNALKGSVITSSAIGLAVAPYVVYGFNQAQIYGVLGNLAILPAASLIVMPGIVAALAAMPFGLEAPFFKFAGFGISYINAAAAGIGSLPAASITLKSMPTSAILWISAGFCTLLFLKTKLKYAGAALIVLGLVIYIGTMPPHVFVDCFGTLFGINEGSMLTIVNRSRYRTDPRQISAWLAKSGKEKSRLAPPEYEIPYGIERKFPRKFYFRNGAAEFTRQSQNNRLRFETVRGFQGERPWSVWQYGK